jgi:hypothetical protein
MLVSAVMVGILRPLRFGYEYAWVFRTNVDFFDMVHVHGGAL